MRAYYHVWFSAYCIRSTFRDQKRASVHTIICCKRFLLDIYGTLTKPEITLIYPLKQNPVVAPNTLFPHGI